MRFKLDLQMFSEITDLTGYKWIGNQYNIYPALMKTFNVLFYDATDLDRASFTQMIFTEGYRGYELRFLDTLSENIRIYEDDAWWDTNEIIFTGGTDVTNAELIAWLEANGTLIAPEPPTPTLEPLRIGTKKVVAMYVGDKEVQKQYIGDKLVYEKEQPQPVGFNIKASQRIINDWQSSTFYSTDNGATWKEIEKADYQQGETIFSNITQIKFKITNRNFVHGADHLGLRSPKLAGSQDWYFLYIDGFSEDHDEISQNFVLTEDIDDFYIDSLYD